MHGAGEGGTGGWHKFTFLLLAAATAWAAAAATPPVMTVVPPSSRVLFRPCTTAMPHHTTALHLSGLTWVLRLPKHNDRKLDKEKEKLEKEKGF